MSGTQLSEAFCKNNNLYRHSELNSDNTKNGFFEDNRRVRAQKFMGVNSSAFFCGLDSLAFTGVDQTSLKVGDKFETLDGVEICKKFVLKPNQKSSANKLSKPKVKVKSYPLFREHVETGQYGNNKHLIQKGDLISIQAKKHGTSGRLSYTKTIKALKPWQYKLNQFLPLFKTESWEYVTGTRRVVLNKPEKEGFHGSEAFRFELASKLTPFLSKGMTLYYEIVGYANGKPIMSKHSTKDLKDKAYTKKYGDEIVYKYGCLEGTNDIYIYRITLTTEDGTDIDFTQTQLVQWCKERDLKPSHDLVEPFIFDGNTEVLDALVDGLVERPECLGEDYTDPSHPSEGVIIRVDRGTTTPLFLKSKNFYFKVMECGLEEPDIEDLS